MATAMESVISSASSNDPIISRILGLTPSGYGLTSLRHRFFWGTCPLDDGLRAASVIASEPSQCLALTRWDFLTGSREMDVEMSILILQELSRRFLSALDSLR